MRPPCSVSVCGYPLPPIAKQRLSKHVPMATNTHTTIDKLLDVSFYMRCISYQRKVCKQFFQELLLNFTFLHIRWKG
jgi:hypothetical protein